MGESDRVQIDTLLATAPPGRTEQRIAIAAIVLSIICLFAMAPFARIPLTQVPAFIPAYEAALAVNDLITAVLLFGQFRRTRRLSLLAIASGYLFDALVVVLHALSFPGVFSPTGLLGAGVQTTAWLYVFWHGAFPGFILLYALIAGTRWEMWARSRDGAVLLAVVGVTLLAAAFGLVSTIGAGILPDIIVQGDYSRMISLGISPAILVLTAVAIAAMWRRRRATVLDMWLFAVLWVWLCDVSLSAVVGSARYDLGWYGGRLFGLFAASFVLCALLFDASKLYGRLEQALATAEAQNAELVRSRADLARVQRLEAVGQLTGGIAHDFNNLLTAILGALEMISRRPGDHDRVTRLADNAAKAANRGARLVRQLMTFARQQALRPEVLNPNSIVLEFEAMTGLAAGTPVAVTLRLDQAIHPVFVDATEFQAALLNLVTNARERDAGRRRVADRDAEHKAGGGRPAGQPRCPTRRLRHGGGDGFRQRHGSRHAGPGVRAVLHHQSRRRGHGPRPQSRVWLREKREGRGHDRIRAGPGHDGPAVSPPLPRGTGGPAPKRRRNAAPGPGRGGRAGGGG